MNNFQNLKNVVINPAVLAGIDGSLSRGRVRITDARDAYERVPLIFRATRIRCNSLISIPHTLTALNGDGETEVDYPFGNLDQLLWRVQAAQLLAGGAFVLKMKNKVRVIDARWLNPFTMTVTWNSTRQRREFYQQINGKRFPENGVWTDADIVFMREFSLSDDIGFGTAAGNVALTDAQLKHYLKTMAASFFDAGGMPVTMLSVVNGFADKDERERVESFFQKIVSGVRNFGRVIAVSGDTKLTTSQAPLKDLAMPELSDESRKDIARAYEMPVTLLDSDETYATARTHQKAYYTDTVIPAASLIAIELNNGLLHPMNLHLEFDPESMDVFQEAEADRATALNQVVTAINAAPPNVVQAAMIILGYDVPDEAARLLFNTPPEPTEANEVIEDSAIDEGNETTQAKIEAAQFRRFVAKRGLAQAHRFEFKALGAEAQNEIWLSVGAAKMAFGSPAHKSKMGTFEQRTAKHETQMRQMVTGLFEKQSAALAKHIGSMTKAAPDLGKASDWEAEFEKTIKPLITQIVADAAEHALRDAGLPLNFDVNNPNVKKFIDARAQRFAEEVNATTWDDLKKSLTAGIDAGESMAQLAARVETVMGDRIRSSAETIARTETISAFNAGTLDAWKQSDVVTSKTWLAALDNRTREDHANAHGQTVGIDEPFDVGGEELMFPGDGAGSASNVINCRCAMTANVE